ncbi:sodium-coupled monocarboxylate transporter 1-like isoform X2 [Bradysia coprophila]|uniref:sodium-coupled monocarboxylate transporter 1-like isoform X2 n=1 Tax=Bradysia coprophila TaxID=38358 RepID=UPI00187D869C|nr:sodium-coupled monocarboxylate transporter 1-like isoform X2 [Bradysia coprophila]
MESELNNGHYFGAVDYGVFGFMLFVSASIGIYFGFFDKREQTTEEYLLGGRQMKTIPIAISLIASQLSAISIMTLPAEIYSFGSSVTLIVLVQVVVMLIINFIFIPIFYNNNIDNCNAYLEMRFSKSVRTIVTISYILTSLLMLPIGSFIPSIAFSAVTGGNIHVINASVSAVCVFYTMLGGIKAVVWTDVIQAGVMLFSLIFILIMSVTKVGDVAEVLDRAIEGNRLHMYKTDFDLTTRQTLWNCVLGFIVMWGGYVGLNQSCVQRIVALPSLHHARRSISATLNSMAGIIYSDYIKPLRLFKHSDSTANLTMKFTIVVLGIFCVLAGFVVEQVESIFQVINTIVGMTCGAVFGVFCLGMLYPRANSKAALWSTIISMACLCWIITGSQVLVSSGELSYTPLETRIDGCDARNISVIFKNQSTVDIADEHTSEAATVLENLLPKNEDKPFSIYRISFPWYPFIGAFIVWIVGIPLSHVIGSADDLDQLNPDLIAPLSRLLIPKRLLHVELPLSTVQFNDVNANEKDPKGSKLLNGNNEWTWSPAGQEDEKQ